MATRLEVMNAALLLLGERTLASVSEDREPRRVLDTLWTPAITHCLENGFWKFAMRGVELTPDEGVDPTFGPAYAFEKPEDFVQLYAISESEDFTTSMMVYVEEGDYWYTDYNPTYVRYVSDDSEWGFDLGKWPESFSHFVSCRLARLACKRIASSTTDTQDLERQERLARASARSKDAMRQPPQFPPIGDWTQARGGGESWRRRTRGY